MLGDLARLGGGQRLDAGELPVLSTGGRPAPFTGGPWLLATLVLLLVERFLSLRGRLRANPAP